MNVNDAYQFYICPCSRSGCLFHHTGTKFKSVKSGNEFKTQSYGLIKDIWTASRTQKMTPCILGAVRACFECADLQSLQPFELERKFYGQLFEGNSLPASIILHSQSDSWSDTRHCLLQIIMDRIPLGPCTRDELYLACATTGFNHFLDRIRLASFDLESIFYRPGLYHPGLLLPGFFPYKPPTTGSTNRDKSMPKLGLVGEVKLLPMKSWGDFELRWSITDISQKLSLGLPVSREFIAKGHVWYLEVPSKNLCEVRLGIRATDQSSQIKGSVSAYLTIYLRKKKAPGPERLSTLYFSEPDLLVSTQKLSQTHDPRPHILFWEFRQRHINGCFQRIKGGGDCNMVLHVKAQLDGWKDYNSPGCSHWRPYPNAHIW